MYQLWGQLYDFSLCLLKTFFPGFFLSVTILPLIACMKLFVTNRFTPKRFTETTVAKIYGTSFPWKDEILA